MNKGMRMLATGVATAAVVGLSAGHAFATNQGTVSGDASVGCATVWNAESVYARDASLYPAGLMTTLAGQPVNGGALGGNGGYVDEVRPEYKGAGIMEINRFLTGSGSTLTLHVRIPLATDRAIENGSLQVTLPDTGSAWTAMADSDALRTISRWGAPYTNYTWQTGAASNVVVDGNSASADYAALPASGATMIEFTSPISDSFLDSLSDYKASFTATATDKSGCTIALPTVTQTQVDGDNNDQVTNPANMTSTTGWTHNTQTFTSTAPKGYYYVVDGKYGTSVDTTVKDNGDWPTRTTTTPVYTTTTKQVPVYGTKTTCTNPVVGTFQVDSYTPTTAAMVHTLAANSARNTLPYRFDGPNAAQLSRAYKAGTYASLWGHSRSEFVTVTLADVQKAGSLRAAIDARTTTVANIGGTIAVGKTYTTAWRLASGATAAAPWTTTPSTAAAKAQTEWDAVTLPKAVCTTSTVQTGTRSVTTTVQTGTTTTTTTLDPAPVTDPTYRLGSTPAS